MQKNKRSELVQGFIRTLAIQTVQYTTKLWIELIAAIYGKANKLTYLRMNNL